MSKNLRTLIPVVFFGMLATATLGSGFYSVGLFLYAVAVERTMAWGHFFSAELALLFGWRFFGLACVAFAVRRGVVRDEQVRIKHGTGARLGFLFATFATAAFFPISDIVLGLFSVRVPSWYLDCGWFIVAVLMFCAFTYPWSRRVEPSAGGNAASPRASA